MAYGRLDVFWPDGKFRSYPLTESTVSVGRSPGSTIALETETISRYHFSLHSDGGSLRLEDMESQNGTFVDGVRVPDGGRVELFGGEEITIGHLRIIYHAMDEMPTQPITPGKDSTQHIVRPDVPFELSVQPPPISIPPGAHASAELTIINKSSERAFFEVQVTDLPASWVRIDRPRLMLDPEESGQVVVNVKPARRTDTQPGSYPLTISVHERSNPAQPLTVQTRMNILPYSGFGIALERRVFPSTERFRLHIHNHGNDNLPLVVSGSERTPHVKLAFVSSPNVTLAPGQRVVVQGKVNPTQRKLLGKPETLVFDVLAKSQDASGFLAGVSGKVVQTALLPAWTPYAAGGIGVLVLGLIALIVSIVTAPVPVINALTVSSTQIARGDTLEIEWEADDVTALQLRVDGELLRDLDPEANRVVIETTALPPNPVIEIVGSARNRSDAMQQRVQVYDPIQLVRFNAVPNQLIRYVVQPLSLNWELQNAEFVQIFGMDAFVQPEGTDAAQRYEASGTLSDINGIPMDDTLILELYAEDALGNPYSQTIAIDAIQPQCSPNRDTVELRASPSERSNVVATIFRDENATVNVDARDPNALWLRVKLPNTDLTGWGALDAFDCADTFNPASLQAVIVPTPTIPPVVDTPTPPLSPSPAAIESPTPGAIITPATPVIPTTQPTSAG